jgi:hypothetical protein
LVRRKICGKKYFQKIQDGGWNEKNRLSRHLGFFKKLFFNKICILLRPIECKKKIEKMLDSLRVHDIHDNAYNQQTPRLSPTEKSHIQQKMHTVVGNSYILRTSLPTKHKQAKFSLLLDCARIINFSQCRI